MIITLPLPEKCLWPNGRAHWATKSRATAKHKAWAFKATREVLPPCFKHNGEPMKLIYTITPKTKHKIDRDNCVAAMKAYQDGIALALKVDDSCFALPELCFAPPCKPGSVGVLVDLGSTNLATMPTAAKTSGPETSAATLSRPIANPLSRSAKDAA